MSRHAPALLLILLAGACARSEDASVMSDPNALAPAIEQRPVTSSGDEEEIANGVWRDALQEQVAALEFTPPEGSPSFSLRCGDGGGLFLQRHGAAPPGAPPVMNIMVGRESRRLALATIATPTPLLRGIIPANDPLIAALGGAATPITIRVGAAPPLVLPPGPQLATFLPRCAPAETAAGNVQATNSSAGNASVANTAAPVTNGAATR